MFATKAFKFDLTKAAAEAVAGSFAGRASVYGVVDSYNDVVMPGAFAKTLAENGNRIVVLNQHDPSDPIGSAELSDSDTALLTKGQLVLDLQSAKDMHTRMENGLINGISIGYEVTDEAYSNGVRQLKEIKLWEISLVTFPANSFARVTDVKRSLSLARGFAAEIGKELKAGRVLSDVNRKKVAAAHGSLKVASETLQELLDLTDPNIDEDSAKQFLQNFKQARLRLKDAQQIADAAAMVDQLIDALDISFDQLLAALGLPDAPDPDDGDKASKALSALLSDMKATLTANG